MNTTVDFIEALVASARPASTSERQSRTRVSATPSPAARRCAR